MTDPDIKADLRAIRESLAEIAGWLRHWKRDAAGNLPSTQGSLDIALGEVAKGEVILDRLEGGMKKGSR